MRIGLINFNKKGVREPGIPPVPPIGLEYLADDLEEDNHEVALLDLCFVDAADRRDAIHSFVQDKELIGITFRNFGVDSLWLGDDQFYAPQLKTVVKEVKEAKNVPVVLGGQGFSIYPQKTLEYVGADFGVYGPGERALRTLAANLGNYSRGSVLQQPANLEITHKRHLINYAKYFAEGGAANIATKFGCPFRCNYCVEQRRVLQRRSMDRVFAELKCLLDLGAKFVFVAEPEFNNHLQHCLSFCRGILERSLKFEWTGYLYPIPMTEELVRLMKTSGCVNPCVSVVSGDDGVLRALDNAFTVKDLRRIAEWFHKYDFPFTVDLLFGGPGETVETARRTIALMEEMRPAVVGMNIGVRIYAGTGFAKRLQAGHFETRGKIYGYTEGNDDLFLPAYYISDMAVRDYLMEVCDSDSLYRLFGYSGFGGVNYVAARKPALAA